MADAALRMNDRIGSDIVRRLVARPIRGDASGMSSTIAAMLATAAPEPVASQNPIVDAEPHDARDHAQAGADVSRLQAEIMVMKAVLQSERRETARLRAQVIDVAETSPVSEEARAVRDRWAALVDQLLDSPR